MTIRIRWNGHYKSGDFFRQAKHLRGYLQDLKAELDSERGHKYGTARLDTCPYCDSYLSIKLKGNTATVIGKNAPRCTNPWGLSKTTFELNVPSGKLVIANDLRKLFPVLKDYNVNGVQGSLATTQEYAAVGMAYGSVGNTCPGVYQTGKASFKVACPAFPERWNGKAWVPRKRKTRWRGKRVAWICTDLWWYSMADRDECERRAQGLGLPLTDFKVDIVDVKPGVYRFVHDCQADRDKPSKDTIFATFKWVRQPDPVADRFGAFMELYESPGRVILQHIRDWPSLYSCAYIEKNFGNGIVMPGYGPERSWNDIPEAERAGLMARVADHLMVTLGSGTDWHPTKQGSWPLTKVDADIPDVPIPEFETLGQHQWYPGSYEYYAMIEVPKLAPDWARLGFNILRNMLKHGWDSNRGRWTPQQTAARYPEAEQAKQLKIAQAKWDDETRGDRRCLRDAAKVYRTARERYPEIAAEHPEFDAWFEQQQFTGKKVKL